MANVHYSMKSFVWSLCVGLIGLVMLPRSCAIAQQSENQAPHGAPVASEEDYSPLDQRAETKATAIATAVDTVTGHGPGDRVAALQWLYLHASGGCDTSVWSVEPALARIMATGTTKERLWAVRLAGLLPICETLDEALVCSMTDTDERTRVEAAAIIAGRGHHEAALAVLGTALASDTPPTRMHAREALWKTCETADPTALLQMLDDIDDPGRILAIELLGDSRSQDLRIADGLERMVSQVNGLPTRASLLWALGGLGQIGADRLISLAASYPELQPWADAGLERAADLATGERPPWVTCDGIAVQVDATEDVRNDTPILRLRVRCRNVSPQHVAVPTYVAGSTSTSPPCAVYYRGRKLPPIGIKITFGPISRGPDHIHYQRLRPGEVWEFWRELRLLDRSSPWIAYYDRTFGISIKGDILAEEPDWWTDVPRGERVGISVPLRALRYTTSIPRVLPGVAGSSDARVWMGDFASAPVYLSLPD